MSRIDFSISLYDVLDLTQCWNCRYPSNSSPTLPTLSLRCDLKEGDQLTLEDLLIGLLLQSGNDNAVAIAEHIGGSVEDFVEMMNQEAAALGATGTHFVNPSGLHDENHYTTPSDLAKLMQYCMKNTNLLYLSHVICCELPVLSIQIAQMTG